MVIIRDDLLGHAAAETPVLLNYTAANKDNSLTNTTNTFAIYAVKLVLEWLKAEGGLPVLEPRNREKARRLYAQIDGSDFYRGYARSDCRSIMNVTFNLPNEDLTAGAGGSSSSGGDYWFIYKDVTKPRAIHYERQGFTSPSDAPR